MILMFLLVLGLALLIFGLYEFLEIQILEKNEEDWATWHLLQFFKNKKSA